jgi:hypothetical protein
MSQHHEDHTHEPRDDRSEVEGHILKHGKPTEEAADVEAHSIKVEAHRYSGI